VSPYVLWIKLRGFYVAEFGERQPLVVLRNGLVLDVNRKARKRGVEVGMSAEAAKAILYGGIFLNWQREEYETRRLDWLNACVDYTGVIEPEDQHTAFLDLSQHPNPLDIADKVVCALVTKTNLHVDYGIAPSKWLARLASEFDDCGLAVRDPQEFLAPLPVSALLPIRPEYRERLTFLGYRNIEEVAQIPLDVLRAQFDAAALQIQLASHGKLADNVQPLYPPDSMSESFIFDGATDCLLSVEDACRMIGSRIGERLSTKGLEGCLAQLKIEFEEGPPRKILRKFAKPIRCARSARAALRALIEEQLDHPVVSLRLMLTDLKKVRQYQPNLIGDTKTDTLRRVDSTLQHLRISLGDDSIKLGSEIEMPRRLKVLKEWKHATGWR
jgi:DNA polymerase IV